MFHIPMEEMLDKNYQLVPENERPQLPEGFTFRHVKSKDGSYWQLRMVSVDTPEHDYTTMRVAPFQKIRMGYSVSVIDKVPINSGTYFVDFDPIMLCERLLPGGSAVPRPVPPTYRVRVRLIGQLVTVEAWETAVIDDPDASPADCEAYAVEAVKQHLRLN